MTVPSLTAGHELVDDDFTFLLPQVALKLSDQTITSSTTMTNDTALVLPMVASCNYVFELFLGYAAAATPQIKVGFTVPSGANLHWVSNSLDSTVTANNAGIVDKSLRAGSTPTLGVDGAATNVGCTITGSVIMSTTAGNLQFQWAQAVSNATGSVVKTGSYLKLRRVA